MSSARTLWAHALLLTFGLAVGAAVLEVGARFAAEIQDRRTGRFDRSIAGLRPPDRGATATLGQMIRRSEDPRVVYELRPRLDVAFAGARVTTNDEGYRGAGLERGRSAGKRRLVGIGDSYMFGQGVADHETYLAQLPGLVRTATGRDVETANLAVPGYNTVMEVALLERRLELLHPDRILIEIVGNDLDLPNFLWDDLDPWTWRRSFLLDFVRGRLRRRASAPAVGPGLSEAPRADASGESGFARDSLERIPSRYRAMVGLDAFREAIARLATLGRERGISVIAMTHGVWFEDEMMGVLKQEGIPVLVLRAALRQRARGMGSPDYARSPLALSPNDLHPSALGHRAVAEELTVFLSTLTP